MTKRNLSYKNLVINGEFSRHWYIGWKKTFSDEMQGALHIEHISSPDDPFDKLLHLHLEGHGNGWIEQKLSLEEGRGIKDLFVEFEMKIATEKNKANSNEPVESFFGIHFTDKDENNLGEIIFSEINSSNEFFNFQKIIDPRCIIRMNPGYNTVEDNLYSRYISCFSENELENISKIKLI